MPPKRSFYVEANDLADGQPIDAEAERRTENEDLKQRILTAQDQLLAVLDNKLLYLALEELLGEKTETREEAMFNVASSTATCKAAATRWLRERVSLLQLLIERIDYDPKEVAITFRPAGLASLGADQRSAA